MGNFYVNFTLKTSDAADVADTLRQADRSAFVTPEQQGSVVVYDEEADEQDVNAIEWLGEMLSKQHRCPVFAVLNHDDDILCYFLFDQGKLIDSYNSAPDYFDQNAGADRGGDVELLCKTLGNPAAVKSVRAILYDEKYNFAFVQHDALCKALGLPRCAVGSGFQSLAAGEVPDGLSEDDLLRIE